MHDMIRTVEHSSTVAVAMDDLFDRNSQR